ncbi:38687_t:CDS:2, partial [Gigaspora margarita]
FADWSCFAVGPKFGKQFHHHCCRLWSKVNHMYQYIEAQDNHNIQEALLRHLDDKLCIADETTKLVASGINLKGYRHIFKSQCFLNISGETIDHQNSLCIVCPLGKFEGDELVFLELKVVVHAKQEQAIAFCSNFLVHGNLPITTGLDWGSNNEEAESSQIYTSPKL